jgi:hypothetical protein
LHVVAAEDEDFDLVACLDQPGRQVPRIVSDTREARGPVGRDHGNSHLEGELKR